MIEGHALEEALGFCIEYLQDFIATTQRVWDEKEDSCMNDEVLEGNGCEQIMIRNFQDMAHSFVLQNMELRQHGACN
jgi:hypothetical protein